MLKGFAEVVEIPETKKDEKYIFGTIKNNGDSSYVTFDGSDFLTPITSAMGYEDGDRVMVMVKSHRAIVVNNMTSPAVTGKHVKENYASFENLSATNAQIGYLRANMITADVLEAKIGEFGYLKADVAELKFASIETLNATNAEITNLKASTITVDNLSAEVAKLGYASVKDLEATTAKIDDLTSKTITADNLRTEIAKIGYLTADEADIRYLTVSTANATFLHADMSDMDIAKIQTLFATAGIVSDMTIKDGHITGVLDSVTVNANSITTGTLSVDRLVIRGSEKSLVYELNNITGALQARSVDTLNGEILTQRTITADKLVAKSITSNEIKAATITSDEIASGTIKAANINVTDLVGNSAFINSLKSNTVIVGLRNDINGISVGGRNLLRNSALSNISFPYSSSEYNWRTASISDGNGISRTKVQITDNNAFSGTIYGIKYTSVNANPYIDIAQDFIKVEDGATYTISAYFKVAKGSGKYRFEYGSNPWPVKSGDVASGWNKYSYTFTYDKSKFGDKLTTNIYFGFECSADFEGYICGFKLEKGNKATDWTPAPEDVDSLISAAQTTANSANSLASTANSAAVAAQTTANTAVSTIGTWCYNNDITYINGGKIYTGTVTADQLAANSVTAGKIKVDSLSAISANIGTVTAGTIQSNNYVKNVSGMKLSLTDGSWDSKYTKINDEGKIVCSNIRFTPSLVSDSYEYFRAISDDSEIMSCSLHHWNNRMWIDLINNDTKQRVMISNSSIHVYAESPTNTKSYHQIAGFGVSRLDDNTDQGYIELAYRKADNSYLRWNMHPDSKTGNLCVYVEELDNTNKASLTTGGIFKATDIQTFSGASLNSLASSLAGCVKTNNVANVSSIEISDTTPYIDFHFNKSSSDYTSRIIEDASGQLSVNAILRSKNQFGTMANIPNCGSHRMTFDWSGQYVEVYVDATHLGHIVIG